MTRITSLLAIALAVVLGLTIDTASAGGRHSRSDCEQRIFQKDETEACFDTNEGIYFFRKNEKSPSAGLTQTDPSSGFTIFLPGPNAECGCQLRRKNDMICAGDDVAFVGSVDRRGRRLFGERLNTDTGEHIKVSGTRVDNTDSCKK